ncbi:MAG: protein-L-isoaspartate(D-aspartate) O-methyltransferase [Armatimonadota bacterium]|nr:protein-L-isoaspartate(D-aspartate) O-methyltransferase [Armatimonadota bacterium]
MARHGPEDASDFERQRQRMVEGQLKPRGIRDERVLRAMAQVPRERFVPEGMRLEAYADRPLPIGEGQTISQPYMVAAMLEALACNSGDVALEVGAGSGYQAALLAELCRQVYAVEIVEKLAERARQRLADLGYENAEVVVGDGTQGLPEHAPYDRIIVAAGAPRVPEPLSDQLADGGRLVIPVGSRMTQRLLIVERYGEEIVERKGMPCVFVPLVGRHGWRPGT